MQQEMSEREQNIRDQGLLIGKLTSKTEAYEEKVSLLTEQVEERERQLQAQIESFDARLRETQNHFEETLAEKESDMEKLNAVLKEKDVEIAARDDDLKAIMTRHEQEINRLAQTGEINIQDEVLKMMEQKLKDINEVLHSKEKVIEVLQAEMSQKERNLSETGVTSKTLQEKLQMTSEQMQLMQENFVTMETEWREEKESLEKRLREEVENHESESSEKSGQIQQLQVALQQYEGAYQQVAAQYNTVQEQYQQQHAELEKTRTEKDAHDSASLAQQEEGNKQIQALQQQLEEQQHRLEELTRTSEETKQEHLAAQAQDRTRIETLEGELQELRQVRSLSKCISGHTV